MNYLVFKKEPKIPPSVTRAIQKANEFQEKENFVKPLMNLLRNSYFLVLCNSYGIIIAVLNTTAFLLNQLVLEHFKVCLNFENS